MKNSLTHIVVLCCIICSCKTTKKDVVHKQIQKYTVSSLRLDSILTDFVTNDLKCISYDNNLVVTIFEEKLRSSNLKVMTISIEYFDTFKDSIGGYSTYNEIPVFIEGNLVNLSFFSATGSSQTFSFDSTRVNVDYLFKEGDTLHTDLDQFRPYLSRRFLEYSDSTISPLAKISCELEEKLAPIDSLIQKGWKTNIRFKNP